MYINCYCHILLLDEIFSWESLNVKTLTNSGLEDFGDEIKSNRKANHGLVFMWQSLANNVIQSILPFFTTHIGL